MAVSDSIASAAAFQPLQYYLVRFFINALLSVITSHKTAVHVSSVRRGREENRWFWPFQGFQLHA